MHRPANPVPAPRFGATPDAAFWQDRRVLVTGHSGFKGAWLVLMLQRLGAQVSGLALPPPLGQPSLHALLAAAPGGAGRAMRAGPSASGKASAMASAKPDALPWVDITDAAALRRALHSASPELVFHLAAQPLVGAGWADPARTYAVNAQGTVNLLDAMRGLPVLRAAVLVTTDKVYRPLPPALPQRPYREGDALGGICPYSASKAAAEAAVAAYRMQFGRSPAPLGGDPPMPRLATARAGNVIGGGDFAAQRLLPDLLRAAQPGAAPARLRCPQATRPWLYVLDALAGYLRLAEHLVQARDVASAVPALNFGPEPAAQVSAQRVADAFCAELGLPLPGHAAAAQLPAYHESPALALDASHAAAVLGWRAVTPWREAVAHTARWARAWQRGDDLRALSLAMLAEHARASAAADAADAAGQADAARASQTAPSAARQRAAALALASVAGAAPSRGRRVHTAGA